MKILHKLRHLIIPHESNNQKAKILHNSSLTILILVLALYQGFLSFFPRFGPRILGYAANISPDEVIRLTNEKRAEAGVGALTTNATLSAAAQAKGADMLAKDYWAHVSPDGTQPWYFFTTFGYKYRYAGENLARDFSDPPSAIAAWMASPSHKENMLSGKYKEIGVAVVEGDLAGVDTTIIVQFFGTNLVDTLPETPVAQAKAAAPAKPEVSPSLVPTKAVASVISITSTPTLTPTVAPALVQAPAGIQTTSPQVLISPFSSTRGISLAVIILLLVIMIIDVVVSYKRKTFRVGGRTLAHIIFIGMILAIVIIARAGKIL